VRESVKRGGRPHAARAAPLFFFLHAHPPSTHRRRRDWSRSRASSLGVILACVREGEGACVRERTGAPRACVCALSRAQTRKKTTPPTPVFFSPATRASEGAGGGPASGRAWRPSRAGRPRPWRRRGRPGCVPGGRRPCFFGRGELRKGRRIRLCTTPRPPAPSAPPRPPPSSHPCFFLNTPPSTATFSSATMRSSRAPNWAGL
jgi:hypothetical protein